MTLSSRDLDIWDRCERRYAFERYWEPKVLSPLGLLYRALEGALPESNPEETAKSLAMKIASKMELQVTALDPYQVATHVGWLAGIIAAYLQAKLGKLQPAPLVKQKSYEWTPGTFEDSTGILHRFVLVDHWSDDRLSAEAHSWATIGELAATGRPLTMHAIVIGAHRGGRRHSAWSKGYLHPVNKTLRFAARKNAKHAGLSGDWSVIWREKIPQTSTEQWLAIMAEDGVLAELVFTRFVKLNPDDRRLLAAKQEIVQIQKAMRDATTKAPMRRSSCDEMGRGPCPFQAVCYSPIEITPAELPHLFRKR